MKPKFENNYFLASQPILESEPIDILNAKQFRINHGLSSIVTKNIINRKNEKVKKFQTKLKKILEKKFFTSILLGILLIIF